jgi:hypothetical protein
MDKHPRILYCTGRDQEIKIDNTNPRYILPGSQPLISTLVLEKVQCQIGICHQKEVQTLLKLSA